MIILFFVILTLPQTQRIRSRKVAREPPRGDLGETLAVVSPGGRRRAKTARRTEAMGSRTLLLWGSQAKIDVWT